MSTPFDSQTWNSALQLNDVTGFDAILERHAPRLSIHDLDSLQSEALNVFVHRTALGGPMLQPLLSLQSVLLQKGDLIGRGLASSAKSPPTRATWLQMREDNNRWRRIVTRLLLGRARGVEPWNDIATSLKLVIEDPTQSSLSVDYAPGNDAWYTIKTVLDSHALEEVLLNEGQEKGIHQHAFRYIGELSGVGSNVGEAFDDTQGLGGQIDAWHLDANIEPGSGSAATEPTAAPTAHPQSGVPATKANAIRRTPHMDAPDGPLAPKTEFDVWIYADKQAPRDGERSTAIVFELPDSILEASVETWISCSSHFASGRQYRPAVITCRFHTASRTILISGPRPPSHLARDAETNIQNFTWASDPLRSAPARSHGVAGIEQRGRGPRTSTHRGAATHTDTRVEG